MSSPSSGNGSRQYRVAFLPRSLEDVDAGFDYIAQASGSYEIALRWLQRIMNAGHSLELFPHRFAFAVENGVLPIPLRQVVIDSHRLIYSVDDATHYARILRVRHAAMRPATRRDLEP